MTDITNADRLARLQASLQEQSLDAMLIMNMVNVRYLTGFTGSAGVLIVKADKATLFVDGRYVEQANSQVKNAACFGAPRPVLDYALQQQAANMARVGFEAEHLSVSAFEQVQALLPGVQLAPLTRAVETLRAAKDEQELAAIQRAIDIIDTVFANFCEWIKPGMKESEVAARLEYEQRMAGGERNASGMTIVASGPRSSLPHGIASDRIIGNNETVMIDIGTVVDGYCSDMTRTVFLGTAPDSFKTLYQLVFDAQQRAIDGIRAGITGIQADKLARDVIVQGGYPDNFDHSLAHAIGLEVHERPLLNPRDGSLLEENMVFTIEPGVYLAGKYGVRIEDIVRVSADGCEIMNNSNRALLEL